jgi:methylated-DNA-[protein]-cysteine S-methyltransferase
VEKAFIKTPLGIAELRGNADGLAAVSIYDDAPMVNDIIPETLEDACYQLQEYFEGTRRDFNLRLNTEGTTFQKSVWEAIGSIPYGKTTTYLELTKKLGNIKAIRAVASACGKNPLWIITPCHRVIGSDNSLTGYAAGLHRKKWLLEHESPYKQPTLF